MVDRRSLADSASSPVDDELRDLSDTSFSSDRLPAFRPPLPPPLPPPAFFGYPPRPSFIPPYYARRAPHPDRMHSPPAFDAYRADPFVRESLRPRGASPTSGRRSVPSEHNRSDNYREEPRLRSPPSPPRGNSPRYYERHDRRRSPPTFDSPRHDERYGRHSPPARENYPQMRDRYSRQHRSRTPSDEESSPMPSNSQRVRSHPPTNDDRYQRSYPSHYTSERNAADRRPPAVRSQNPVSSNDDYPTY